jgi:hypothetical protein
MHQFAPAEVFEQQNHLVFLIAAAAWWCTAHLLELRDTFGQIAPAGRGAAYGFEDAGAQKVCDILQFVGGKTQQEIPRLLLKALLGTCSNGGNQGRSQARTPGF